MIKNKNKDLKQVSENLLVRNMISFTRAYWSVPKEYCFISD
ncbi:hypothetical protein PALI_b0819 [Pseudoalteromonas aliena SW19]|uniref:Uncharacterized protein n=1 Tax=Pseudoalteromonas aliena SW19 TaxID=1314866 RepID=A0ABR9E7G3_9GAMM|nr:hypothetical protein [Pseudoalteromonas aliena SW19]